jgi:hypothetical protein
VLVDCWLMLPFTSTMHEEVVTVFYFEEVRSTVGTFLCKSVRVEIPGSELILIVDVLGSSPGCCWLLYELTAVSTAVRLSPYAGFTEQHS